MYSLLHIQISEAHANWGDAARVGIGKLGPDAPTCQ